MNLNRDSAIAAVQDLLTLLRDSRLVWTRELPKKPGFYFTRDSKREVMQVVEIRIDYGDVGLPLVVQSGHPAERGVEFLSTYAGAEFAGPIEQPS